MNGRNNMYEYRCKVIRVVDGDTVDVDIDLGFGVWLQGERIRLVGIDAPESRTSDPVEKVFGLLAKEWLENRLPVGSIVLMKSKDFKGKFGRILGDFELASGMVSELMIKEHMAVPYYGNSKEQIEELHEANRKILIESGKVNLD